MYNNYDVIIGGAGISGLLIASELSKDFKVLVIEAKQDIPRTKYWVTLSKCAEINPEISHLIDHSFSKMQFSDSYRNTYTLTGNYVFWDADKLLDSLYNQILKNAGKIYFSQRFCGYRNNKSKISVFINEHEYQTTLFIDCMGYNSPLILAKNTIDIKGYYLLYGSKIRLTKPITPVCLSNIIIDKNPKYFEVFPNSNGEAYATIILPSSKSKDMKGLAGDFKYIIRSSLYAEYFDSQSIQEKLWGIIPVGKINKRALDHIYFFGEAGQNNPATSATCLTTLLLNYKSVAQFLGRAIINGDVSASKLAEGPKMLNSFIKNFQMEIFKRVLSSNSDSYSKFISIIPYVDHELINKFIFGELVLSDIAKLNYFIKLLKPRNIHMLGSMLRSF